MLFAIKFSQRLSTDNAYIVLNLNERSILKKESLKLPFKFIPFTTKGKGGGLDMPVISIMSG